MAAIACLLSDLGHQVEGCDVSRYIFTEKELKKRNISIDSFDNFTIKPCDYVIIGNSFENYRHYFDSNKVLTYQEVIAYLSNKHFSVAVCGTHGKTTTSHMVYQTLKETNKCSTIIGDGYGKATKDCNTFVFEACEYKDNFLNYTPNIILVTNIDYDHVDYFKTNQQYVDSFINFINNAKNFALINNDDVNSNKIKDQIKIKYYTYGIDNKSDVQASNILYLENGISFDIKYGNITYKNLFVPLFGKHIFYDALSCIALSLILQKSIHSTIKNLSLFKHPSRRFNVIECHYNNIIVDDYGHHPLEIQNTINAIKQKYNYEKLIIIFHPDRASRIDYFFKQYIEVFSQANKTFVIPFLNVENDKQEQDIIKRFSFVENIEVFDDNFFNNSYKNTIFLFTGSKDMSQYIRQLLNIL